MLKECGKNTKSKKQSRAKTHTGARTERMDKSGRRSSKTVGGQTTTYIYNGQNLIAERGASVAEFLFGPGIDEPLAMSRSGSAYYYDVDGLGSAILVNDTGGTVQDKYLYDSWGITRSSTTPIANPFVYTARETAEAGLLFYRARYYNPNVGRFVSEDPMFNYVNNYYYVRNIPTELTDPTGELAVKVPCYWRKTSPKYSESIDCNSISGKLANNMAIAYSPCAPGTLVFYDSANFNPGKVKKEIKEEFMCDVKRECNKEKGIAEFKELSMPLAEAGSAFIGYCCKCKDWGAYQEEIKGRPDPCATNPNNKK